MSAEKFSKDELRMPKEPLASASLSTHSYTGMILGSLVFVLMLILGGLYLWNKQLQENAKQVIAPTSARPTATLNNEPESTNAEADVETITAMSNSDEIDAIDADLGSTLIQEPTTDTNSIDAEIKNP